MKEPYRKGIANHPGPESCEGSRDSREAALEALTGVQADWVSSAKSTFFREPTTSDRAEGNTVDVNIARPHHPAWSETPDMPGNSMRENRETPAAPAV
jgi:hypothetical protein